MTQLIEMLREEHRNIEKLLTVLESELDVFDHCERPDYEIVQAVITYFQDYPDCFHHPKEDLIFDKLKLRDPAAVASIGDLEAEHQDGSRRLERVAKAVNGILIDQEVLREKVDAIVRDFIDSERLHITMEERVFFPSAVSALQPEDWAEIEAKVSNPEAPLFDKVSEANFNSLQQRILQWEREAEAERA
ncbi:MAG: hemerythrin domain-containing protein [Beijerinckiaceae bacterium]